MTSPFRPHFIPSIRIEDITRRRLIGSGLAAAFLIACGEDDEPPAATPTPEPTTRIIEASNGRIEIPAKPARIVALFYAAVQLIDLGVTPIAVTSIGEEGNAPNVFDVAEDIEVVGRFPTEVDVERVLALSPDLVVIVGPNRNAATATTLSAIVPTLFFELSDPSQLLPMTPRLAEALGRESELKVLQDAHNAVVQRIKTNHADLIASKKIALAYASTAGLLYVYGTGSHPGGVLAPLNLRYAAAAAVEQTTEFSFEQLNVLSDADIIVVPGSNLTNEPTAATKAMLDQPAWATLPAVRAGQVYVASYFLPSYYSAATKLLENFDAIFTKAKAS